MQEALQESEEKYRRLFEGLNDAAFVADAQTGVILEANARAETLLGRTREEIVGMHQIELHPPAEAARYREKFASHAAKGRVAEQDADVLRKDGTVVPVAISAATMTLGGRYLMLGLFRDITEQRRLEREFLNLGASIQRRIGQDLHGSLGQVLTGIAFHAKGLEKELAARDGQAAEKAARVRQLANDAISQARSPAQGLCPVELGADGLMSALEEHAAVVQELFGIPCSFRCDHPVLIEDHDRATQLYYIAREATNNAVRHAAPRSITVALRADDGMISVVVRDDGKGLLPDWEESGGMGVRTMRYRAAMIGGTLDLHSHEEGGTTVTCVLDMHANSNGGGVDHEGKGASEAARESREGPDR
ncbi:MAG: PAS domain-containing sensor histidine kinase [Candidatus Brocadiia bacterium]|nr:PAS domain-containing sensor histidine kinase [Candidatus Brocadiia bacterium]